MWGVGVRGFWQDSDTEVCPGGPPGTCGAGRDGSLPACGQCLPGYFDPGDGCTPCVTPLRWCAALQLIIIIIIIIITIIIVIIVK